MIPFSFSDYRICVKCGNKTVELYDRFNRPTHIKIYPVTRMVCSNCGTVYNIRWIDDQNNNKIPVCTDKYSIIQFENNIIEYAKENRRKL